MCFSNRVSYVKHTDQKIQFWSDAGYMVLWVDLGVIWWLRVLAEVRVRDWRCCAVRMGD